MAEEPEEVWPRKDLGRDPKAWRWALGQLARTTVVPLATMGEDGPRVRPVTVLMHEDTPYVLTGARDAKMLNLRADPRFEFYVMVEEGESSGYVRFMGRVMIVEDLDLRKEVGDASGYAWDYFNGPDDPNYALLEMSIRRAEVMRPGVKGYELLSR